MEANLLRKFCDLAYEKAGISLTVEKGPLVTARLAKRLRALGLSSEREYLALLGGAGGEDELVNFLDAISTNFTCFFREETHFQHLTELLTSWLAEGRRKFRFWSAASSTGEEPYTMAIVLEEAFTGLDVDYRILATDISTRVLTTAREGVYGEAQISRVPKHLRHRYFSRSRGPAGVAETHQVLAALREKVTFARLNLSAPPFPMKGPFDVVFCRNVMIYFDQVVRQGLVSEIERVLAPGGLLMIGHAETLNGIATNLRPVRASTYRKAAPGDAARAAAPGRAR
jgi:chemotaxis protein methyltransferase CheR